MRIARLAVAGRRCDLSPRRVAVAGPDAARRPPQTPAPPPAPRNARQRRSHAIRSARKSRCAAKTIVYMQRHGQLGTAFETLVEAFKKINEALGKQGVKPAGPADDDLYATDDTGFEFQAGVPVAEAPKGPLPGGLAVGKSPEGKALKFIHRGSYDAMDSTYEAITNHLDEKRLEAKDLFVE